MLPLRRFRIKSAEYEKVLSWLHKAIAAVDDEKADEPAEQSEYRMPADYLPKIKWAHLQPLKQAKVAHGKIVLQVKEGDTWKELVHERGIDPYLRESLLSPSADVPMSRDAGYHIVQKRTVGISRRAFAKFISKQAVLQITKDRLPEKKQPGKLLKGRGYLELDLVEAKGKDIGKWVHHPVKNYYWITLIDRLTGWLEVERILHKDTKSVAPKMKKMLKNMRAALKSEIKYIRSDAGSEFKADTAALFEELKIKHRFVKSGNRVEQANKTFQKIWYRLMRLGRGDLNELDTQATAIFNNTLSSINGNTPLEALDVDDAILRKAFKDTRRGVAEYKAVEIKKGDRVRYLIQDVVGKHLKALGYKSYRGKHWSADVHTVVKYNKHTEAYYVGGKWRQRDKLLLVPGVDALTRDAVNRRHRLKKKDWEDDIGDLAL